MGGILGDVVLVNGAPWPRFAAAKTLYRLRLLNTSNSRWYELQFATNGLVLPFTQIGTDGGLLWSPARKDRFSSLQVRGQTSSLTSRCCRSGALQRSRTDVHVGECLKSCALISAALRNPPGPYRAFLSDVRSIKRTDVSRIRHFHFRYHSREGWFINNRPFDPERTDAAPHLEAQNCGG
jgi:spore coat protein A